MFKIFFFTVFSFYSISFAQSEKLDKIELRDGTILIGKVEKITETAVDFRENESALLYEYSKNNIRYILLSNDKVITFDNNSVDENDGEKTSSSDKINSIISPVKSLSAIYFGAGFSIPSAPDAFSEYWNTGYNIGASINFGVSTKSTLGLGIFYNSFNLNSEKLFKDSGLGEYNFTTTGGEVSLILAVLDMKINLSENSFRPYLIGDLGYYSIEFGSVTVSLPGTGSQSSGGTSEDGVTFGIGLGFDIVLSPNINLFFEGRYQSAATEEESTIFLPFRTGIALSLARQ